MAQHPQHLHYTLYGTCHDNSHHIRITNTTHTRLTPTLKTESTTSTPTPTPMISTNQMLHDITQERKLVPRRQEPQDNATCEAQFTRRHHNNNHRHTHKQLHQAHLANYTTPNSPARPTHLTTKLRQPPSATQRQSPRAVRPATPSSRTSKPYTLH